MWSVENGQEHCIALCEPCTMGIVQAVVFSVMRFHSLWIATRKQSGMNALDADSTFFDGRPKQR